MGWAQGGKGTGKAAVKGKAAPKAAGAQKTPVQQTQWKTNGQAGGKAKGKGKGDRTPLPANFKVNENTKYQGKVVSYYKFNGYGFVQLSTSGVVPEDKVFVHWSRISSDDRFPTLTKDMDVELTICVEEDKNGNKKVGAKTVTMPGGGNVAIQDAQDAEKKEFIGGQDLRYTGKLKFYKAKDGFGYITMDDGFAVDASVPKELRCEMAEMNAGGAKPGNMKEVSEVEFGIWKTSKGAHKAYNVTLPGGMPLPAWEQKEWTS